MFGGRREPQNDAWRTNGAKDRRANARPRDCGHGDETEKFGYPSAMERLQRATGCLALFALGLGLGGCKDEETSVNGYVDGISRRVCDAVVECECDYDGGSNYDHCVQQLGVGTSTLAELNGVEGLSFDGECADKQISEIGRLGCGVPTFDTDAECERPCKVWVGPTSRGGTCTSVNGFDNCKQGLSCGNGVCVDPCDEPDLPQIGEPCAPQFGCDEGAWCDDASMPLLPVCAALPNAGEPCLGVEQNFACNVELMCDTSDPDAPVCMALPGLDEECPLGACAEDLFCDTIAAPFVCAALPGLGDLCPQGICTAPNLCDGGVCIEPRPQVCGLYSGVPEGLDPTDTGGETGIDPTMGETGVGPTGGETGIDPTFGETDGAESGIGGNSCCLPSDTPACDDVEVATCVCQMNESCCFDGWSQDCVNLASKCGGC